MAAQGYDPTRSRVTDDAMATFLATELTDDLRSVPGVGPAAVERLKAKQINNLPQLIAKYMSFTNFEENENGENVVDVYTCNQHFWHFLQDAGINSNRSGIVTAINRKIAQAMPIYADDEANYESLTNN